MCVCVYMYTRVYKTSIVRFSIRDCYVIYIIWCTAHGITQWRGAGQRVRLNISDSSNIRIRNKTKTYSDYCTREFFVLDNAVRLVRREISSVALYHSLTVIKTTYVGWNRPIHSTIWWHIRSRFTRLCSPPLSDTSKETPCLIFINMKCIITIHLACTG